MFKNFDYLDLAKYEALTKAMSALSGLFSESQQPYIPYRFAENLFLYCVNGQYQKCNLSRADNSFDSVLSKDEKRIGVGVKTFVKLKGQSKEEKVAEFTKVAGEEDLKALSDKDLMERIAKLRNLRVESDAQANCLSLEDSFYHCLVRGDNCFFIHEEPYPLIDLNTLRLDGSRQSRTGNIAFRDDNNLYKYSTAKNVLYKRFDLKSWVNTQSYPVIKITDPFLYLEKLLSNLQTQFQTTSSIAQGKEFVVLPLYKTRGKEHEVAERSGINQWNAGGRERKFGEAYIPVPKALLDNRKGFFPFHNGERGLEAEHFELTLPSGKKVSAKLCQANFKGLMSSPNADLLEWVFAVIDGSIQMAQTRFNPSDPTKNRPYTYADLVRIGKDAVYIFKNSHKDFTICFAPFGAYDYFKETDYKKMPLETFEEQLNEFTNREVA